MERKSSIAGWQRTAGYVCSCTPPAEEAETTQEVQAAFFIHILCFDGKKGSVLIRQKKKKSACAAYFFLVPACARTGARVLPGGSVDSRFDYS